MDNWRLGIDPFTITIRKIRHHHIKMSMVFNSTFQALFCVTFDLSAERDSNQKPQSLSVATKIIYPKTKNVPFRLGKELEPHCLIASLYNTKIFMKCFFLFCVESLRRRRSPFYEVH